MSETHTAQAILLARILVVCWWLGRKGTSTVPKTVSESLAMGHDGLNWQEFLPLAEDFLKDRGCDE